MDEFDAFAQRFTKDLENRLLRALALKVRATWTLRRTWQNLKGSAMVCLFIPSPQPMPHRFLDLIQNGVAVSFGSGKLELVDFAKASMMTLPHLLAQCVS